MCGHLKRWCTLTNVTQESIELAQQLFALHDEALGYPYRLSWDSLEPRQREAWVQVAQFVEARSNRPNWMTDEQLKEANENYKRWGYGIPDHR